MPGLKGGKTLYVGFTAVVAALLEAGAEVDAGGVGEYSASPLFMACKAGNGQCVHLLLLAGARVDFRAAILVVRDY